MKRWLYELDMPLIVNESAKLYLPDDVGKTVHIHERLSTGKYEYIVRDESGNKFKVRESELDRLGDVQMAEELGKFGQIGLELGKFTDEKNKQYGSSVDATYQMMLVLMERYKTDENTYTIPGDLIQHMLLTVRMMDKQNRIFNNPSGDGDSESPYRDLTGYSIIGVDMTNK